MSGITNIEHIDIEGTYIFSALRDLLFICTLSIRYCCQVISYVCTKLIFFQNAGMVSTISSIFK